ncbi:MAG TPA: aminotransferase class III-fold pyridoxal phosphate-dependent enzyme, partial [Mycobacteriales bacterium]
GRRLADAIEALDHRLVGHVRGLGLWRAVVLREPVSAQVEQAARDAGLLVNAVAPTVLRLAPPLVVSIAQVDEAVRRLAAALDAVAATIVCADSSDGA